MVGIEAVTEGAKGCFLLSDSDREEPLWIVLEVDGYDISPLFD